MLTFNCRKRQLGIIMLNGLPHINWQFTNGLSGCSNCILSWRAQERPARPCRAVGARGAIDLVLVKIYTQLGFLYNVNVVNNMSLDVHARWYSTCRPLLASGAGRGRPAAPPPHLDHSWFKPNYPSLQDPCLDQSRNTRPNISWTYYKQLYANYFQSNFL